MKQLTIKTTKNKYYRQLLEFLRPIKPFSMMNNKDLDVLGLILTEYMGLRGLKHENRCQLVFSSSVRKKIADRAGMSQAAFNNSISKIRKLGFIKDKIILEEAFVNRMTPSEKLEVKFIWKRD